MATGFAYIPATSDGCTVIAPEPERGDEYPDGYGGFGAPRCDCGELLANCGCVAQSSQGDQMMPDWLSGRTECKHCGMRLFDMTGHECGYPF